MARYTADRPPILGGLRQRASTLPIAILLLLALALAACARTAADIQRDYVKETLAPRQLEVNQDAPRPALQRRLHLRAFADNDYRKQNFHWEQRIRAQVGRANAILQAQFGAELVVDAVLPWEHDTPDDATLDASLAALEKLDRAEGVDYDVGFVGARSFSHDWHHMGMARTPGRHMVLRGTTNVGQRDALDKRLQYITEQERDKVWKDIRLHEETLLLLHEWAHALGALHDGNGDFVMSPLYDAHIANFSPPSVEVIQLGLARQGQGDLAADKGWQAARAAVIAAHPRAFQDVVVTPEVAPSRPGTSAAERFNAVVDAQKLLRSGQIDAAQTQLQASFQAATATGETDAKLLQALATVLLEAGRLTAAETIAAQLGFAPEGLALRARVLRQRRVIGLQPGAVADADEPRYGRDYAHVRDEVAAKRADAADGLLREFPRPAGGLALQCVAVLNTRGGATRGKKLCEAALERWPETLLAHQALASLARAHGDLKTAIAHLRAVVELVDDFEPAWQELANALAADGQKQARDELAARFAKNFAKPLPTEP